MRLLLTRAEEDATRTRTTLEANGHSVVVSPVIEIVLFHPVWPDGVIDALLATSGHAFAALRSASKPSVEARRLVPLLLVGSRTQEQARRCGFCGDAVVMPNATTLVVQIGDLVRKPQRILYLAGRDRKPDIERAFRITGLEIEVLETYEARAVETLAPAAISAFEAGRLDGVLHFSNRSATLFLRQAEKAGLDVRSALHLCLSDDVAVPCREAGCRVAVAEAPTEPALLAFADLVSAQA